MNPKESIRGSALLGYCLEVPKMGECFLLGYIDLLDLLASVPSIIIFV